MSELFDAVDALVASRSPLPPPAERRRLRQAHGLTLDEVAAVLKVRRATVGGWEAGKTEPRPPERDAYARLLDKLAELYPAPTNSAAPGQDTAVSETFNSNTINLLGGIAVPAVVIGLGAVTAAERSEMLWFSAMTAVTLLWQARPAGIGRLGGAVLVAAYAVFLAVQLG